MAKCVPFPSWPRGVHGRYQLHHQRLSIFPLALYYGLTLKRRPSSHTIIYKHVHNIQIPLCDVSYFLLLNIWEGALDKVKLTNLPPWLGGCLSAVYLLFHSALCATVNRHIVLLWECWEEALTGSVTTSRTDNGNHLQSCSSPPATQAEKHPTGT